MTTIILLLIVVILFIIAKQKRTRTAAVLDALQHNLHTDGLSLGLDKRFNSNFKVNLVNLHFIGILDLTSAVCLFVFAYSDAINL